MAGKGFKRLGAPVATPSPSVPGPVSSRPDPAAVLAAAQAVAPTLPPTRVEPETPSDPLAQLNLKVRTSLIDQLAEAAARDGTTQKVVVCRALAAAGFVINPSDLADRSNHRRRR